MTACLISTQIALQEDGNLIDLGQTRGVVKGSVVEQTAGGDMVQEADSKDKKDKGKGKGQSDLNCRRGRGEDKGMNGDGEAGEGET